MDGEDIAENAYGSLVDVDLDESVPDSEESEEEVEEVHCSCKGACARKQGRGFCPCRAAGKTCSTNCSCSSKCKNKETQNTGGIQQVEPIDPDGEVQLQNEIQAASSQIEEFVLHLPQEDMMYILKNILAMGRGSLDFAKQLIQERHEPPSPSTASTSYPQWCKCKKCKTMPTETENVCCNRVNCLTNLQVFKNICLDRDILEICIKARCDIRADEFNFSMESFRKAAYRQFILWRYGKLGRGNRRVVPSCTVLAIRSIYPSQDGNYMGYKNI